MGWQTKQSGNKKPGPMGRVLVMPKVGFEPTRANAHYALNVARLPISPLRPAEVHFTNSHIIVKL